MNCERADKEKTEREREREGEGGREREREEAEISRLLSDFRSIGLLKSQLPS